MASDGSVLVADEFNQRLRRIALDGTMSSIAGNGIFGSTSSGPASSTSLDIPGPVATDTAGNIYISNNVYNESKIFRIDPSGALSELYKTSAVVYGIATDPKGNVLLISGNQILRIAADGTATVIAGTGVAGYSGDNGPAVAAELNQPQAVAADSAGNVYIADTNNLLVRKVSPNGIISTIGGGATSVKDNVPATQSAIYPYALACDSAGNVYVVDTWIESRVRMISPSGVISSVAGNGISGFFGDGGLATSASLNRPIGIAVDRAGNVYVADSRNNRIREVLSAPPTISVSSTNLPVSAPSAGTPAQATVAVNSSSQGIGYSLTFSTQSGGNWLSASLTQGQAPGTFQIIADPTNLAAGMFPGTVTVSNPYAVPPTQTIAVAFQVTAGAPPQLSAGTGPLTFALSARSPASTVQLAVSNLGSGSLSFAATAGAISGGSWLQISPANGTATASTPAFLTVTATPGTLQPGTYSGFIILTSASGQNVTVNATLALSPAEPTILLSQTGLTFTSVVQGGAPLPQSFGILNTGQGSMNWSASATPLSGGSWLSIDQTSGTVTTPYQDVSSVNVSVNPVGLPQGTYYGQILVTAPGAPNSPQSVSIILNVLAAGSNPGMEVRPTGLIFVGQPGNNPGSQTVMISTPQSNPVTFAGTFFTLPTGGSWARFLPVNATVQPNAPVSVLVQPDFSNLTSGTYEGFVSLGFADGSSHAVHILAVVAPPASQSSSGEGFGLAAQAAASCAPIRVVPTSLTDPGSSVTIGVGAPLTLRAVDSCGHEITASNGNVAAGFSDGETSVNLVSEGNGYWSRTWTPAAGRRRR